MKSFTIFIIMESGIKEQGVKRERYLRNRSTARSFIKTGYRIRFERVRATITLYLLQAHIN